MKFSEACRKGMRGGVLLLMGVAGLCSGILSAGWCMHPIQQQAAEQATEDDDEATPPVEPWYAAICEKDADALRKLLDSGEVGPELYQEILYRSAMLSFAEGVRMMLQMPGIDVNAPIDDSGNSPLMVAMDDEECFRLLLEHPDVNVNHVNNGNLRAVDWLFLDHNFGNITALLLNDPRVDSAGISDEMRLAVMRDDAGGIRRVLQSGLVLSPHWQEAANEYVCKAAALGNTASLRELLALPGMPVFGIYETDDESPLALAMKYGRDDCVRLLLEHPWSREHREIKYLGTMLRKAVKLGRADYVELFLNHPGMWYYAQDALFTAAERGDMQMLRLLLKYPGVNINNRSISMSSVLHEAAAHGHVEALRLFLSRPGIFINRVNHEGETPLQLAMKHGHAECIRLLLAATTGRQIQAAMPEAPELPGGLPVEVLAAQLSEGRKLSPECRPYKNTPLLQAADDPDMLQLIQALDKPGVDVNERNNYAETALHLSAYHGHTGAVVFLQHKKGVDINARDESGMTPLMNAALCPSGNGVGLLLYAPGIQVDSRTVHGETALMFAAMNENAKAVKMLLTHPETDPLAADCDGRTALHMAARYDNADAIRLLLAKVSELDVNTADFEGLAPLHLAVEYGFINAVKALLAHPGINVDAQDSMGRSAVHYTMRIRLDDAKTDEFPEGVHLLAAAGASLNIRDLAGRTPLMLAVQRNAMQIMQALLSEPGVDVNAADTLGRTPLHYLAVEEETDMLKLLLTAPGLNLQATDIYGFTPIDLARKCSNYDALTLLHEAIHGKTTGNDSNQQNEFNTAL